MTSVFLCASSVVWLILGIFLLVHREPAGALVCCATAAILNALFIMHEHGASKSLAAPKFAEEADDSEGNGPLGF